MTSIMEVLGERFLHAWKRVISLSWPVMAEHTLRTLMRTTDILVAGFFSPAAVAAVGLADIYGRLTLRVGLGLGDGTIALLSQDTGSETFASRNEVVSQALLLGLVAGVPFAIFGLVGSYWAIDILGADNRTIQLGAIYLSITLLSAPIIHVTKIAARAIQGTGDTRTPMWINLGANTLNISLTIIFAFGLGPVPELSVLGIALATALGDFSAAISFLIVICGSKSSLQLVWPSKLEIGKQLIVVSMPQIAEGAIDILAGFPINAILLTFGTEVNAAFQIGRRIHKQVIAPVARGYSIGANILVGQALGRSEPEEAYFNGLASTVLAITSTGCLGLILFFGSEWIVLLFTRDETTIQYAIDFARTYAVASFLIAGFLVLAGSLRGGSETRPPLIAKGISMTIFLLGITYVFGVRLEYGVIAAYIAIVTDIAVRFMILIIFYSRRQWLDRGASMMNDRKNINFSPED